MNKNFTYQSDEYDRQTQRFVTPLYIKNTLGEYQYSSTATFVKYNNHHYIIFAAHALEEDMSIKDVHIFYSNGELESISNLSIGHYIFKTEDIVIVDCFNNVFDGKNYFNLNEKSLIGFEKSYFAWTGFPASKSKAKKIHNKKTSEMLYNEFVYTDSTGKYFTNAKYFTIISKLISQNNNHIVGKYNRDNVYLKYKGQVNKSTHPKGMSGGAIYFFSKRQNLKNNIDDTFRFAGIGIEYHSDNKIIGVSREKIIELLNIFDNEYPLRMEMNVSI